MASKLSKLGAVICYLIALMKFRCLEREMGKVPAAGGEPTEVSQASAEGAVSEGALPLAHFRLKDIELEI